MSQFKSLDVYKFPRTEAVITEENSYWKQLGFPLTFKEFGAIDFIDFSLQEPHHAAVTCAAKVQIYSLTESNVEFNLSRFKKSAYGGVFRKDGNLLIAGSEDGVLRLFDIKGHRLLRMFKGHKAATHRCNFTTDGVNIVSFSDDKSTALWDIPTETRIASFEEHKDYIRAGAVSQVSKDIIVSGSYDHHVKMYDTRSGGSVVTVDHGAPVEAVLMMSSGGLLVSAGGTTVKVWDLVAGRLLAQVSQHHKTITCLCLASDGRRLMSGSLDRHVKIYDVNTYEVVHTLSYPSPILSVAVSPNDKAVGVGMTDGIFSLRLQKPPKVKKEEKKSSSFHSHQHGTDYKQTDSKIVVHANRRQIHTKYEQHLRKFEYTKALDYALKKIYTENEPEVTVSVIMELMRRNAIRPAMAAREGDSLKSLMHFVNKYIGDPRFMRILIDVGLILIELYGPQMNEREIRKTFKYFAENVGHHVQYMQEMSEVQGVIQTILAATYTAESVDLV